MSFQSRLVLFAIFFWVLGSVAAPPPAIVYRGSQRPPKHMKSRGGIESHGASNGIDTSYTLLDHVRGWPASSGDPYVSTSSKAKSAAHFVPTGYVYHIDTTGIANIFSDVAEAKRLAGESYDFDEEAEFSAYLKIPWSAVIGWDIIEYQQFTGYKKNGDYVKGSGACKRDLVGCANPNFGQPAVKSPAVKSPAVKSPTVKSPTGKSPTGKTSTVKPPTVKQSTVKSPSIKPAIGNTLGSTVPASTTPTEPAPGKLKVAKTWKA